MNRTLLLFVAMGCVGCAARNYTYYLVDQPPKKALSLKEEPPLARPLGWGTATVMKVRWNDGQTLTEIDVPVLASGQRIIIEHGEASKEVKTIAPMKLVPPPPTAADTSLVEAYRAKGLAVRDGFPEVSLSRASAAMQEATKTGNYALALEWAETVLQRYPSHPEFLRAKASILLMMGEKDKAIEIYEKAEAVESDPAVRKKLEELQRQQR
jgi:tetratricopeptide (TPR) repeat protein